MIEHCISAFSQERKEQSYQHYIAECVRLATENTAKTVCILGHGEIEASYMTVSYGDMINKKPVEEKTEQQIIDEMQAEFDRLGFEKPKTKQVIG